MGSSESKLSVASTPKPQPEAHRSIRTLRHGQLLDPRSPSTCIDRTPIQVNGTFPKTSAEENIEFPQQSFDPRSPTIGIVRTPARDTMRETVGSFARRLGMLFHSEVVPDKVPQGLLLPSCLNLEEEEEEVVIVKEEVVVGNEQSSAEPLLSLQPPQTLTSVAEHVTFLPAAVLPVTCVGSSSPFVLLEEAHMDTADLSVEEAEEARESPLHKRLSMSLITCHEEATPAETVTEVQVHVSPASPPRDAASAGEEHHHHSSVTVTAEAPPSPALVSSIEAAAENDAPVAPASPERPEESAPGPAAEQQQQQPPATDVPQCAAAAVTLAPPVTSCQEKPRPSTGIQCPTFDPRSPSQVVFKPQWLGKGFGTAGLRARGARASKGGSSPLAVRVAVNNVNNENMGKSAKPKQKAKGLSEGRSPLQILKTNSPRDKQSQMKLKASTPERQRSGLVERRVLAAALDKENR